MRHRAEGNRRVSVGLSLQATPFILHKVIRSIVNIIILIRAVLNYTDLAPQNPPFPGQKSKSAKKEAQKYQFNPESHVSSAAKSSTWAVNSSWNRKSLFCMMNACGRWMTLWFWEQMKAENYCQIKATRQIKTKWNQEKCSVWCWWAEENDCLERYWRHWGVIAPRGVNQTEGRVILTKGEMYVLLS